MDDFEQELQREMRQVQVPPGFADRVLEVTAGFSVDRPAALRHWSMPWRRRVPQRWVAAGLAATVLLGTSFGVEQEHRRRQREAERQFAVAMQVTSHALEQTREQLSRAGFRLAVATKD